MSEKEIMWPLAGDLSGSSSITKAMAPLSAKEDKEETSHQESSALPGSTDPRAQSSPSAAKFQTTLQSTGIQLGNHKWPECSDDKAFEKIIKGLISGGFITADDAAEICRDYRRLNKIEDQAKRQHLKKIDQSLIANCPQRQGGIFALPSGPVSVKPKEKIVFTLGEIRLMAQSWGMPGEGTAGEIRELIQIFRFSYDIVNLSYRGVQPGPKPYESEEYEELPEEEWENRLCSEGSSPEILNALKDLKKARETFRFKLFVNKNSGSKGSDAFLNFPGAANKEDEDHLISIFRNEEGARNTAYEKLKSGLTLFEDSSRSDAPRRLKAIFCFSLGAIPAAGGKIASPHLSRVPLLLFDPVPMNTPLAKMFGGTEDLQKLFSCLYGIAIGLNKAEDPVLNLSQSTGKLGCKYPGLFMIYKMLGENDSRGFRNGEPVPGTPEPNLLFGYHGRDGDMQMYANTILMFIAALQEMLKQMEPVEKESSPQLAHA